MTGNFCVLFYYAFSGFNYSCHLHRSIYLVEKGFDENTKIFGSEGFKSHIIAASIAHVMIVLISLFVLSYRWS